MNRTELNRNEPKKSLFTKEMSRLDNLDLKKLAVGWPSDIRVGVGVEDFCCAIHKSVVCGQPGAVGCRGWSPGTHKSVAVLYDPVAVNTYCHAMAGQLVLDRRVADEAVLMLRSGNVALGRGALFGAKYQSGYAISVSGYGAGYCYLVAFSPNVRSRVARILGPLPYVADVLRLMRVVGMQAVSARWQFVSKGLYHVVACSQSKGPPLGGFFRFGCALLSDVGVDLRVGVEFPIISSLFGTSSSFYSQHFAGSDSNSYSSDRNCVALPEALALSDAGDEGSDLCLDPFRGLRAAVGCDSDLSYSCDKIAQVSDSDGLFSSEALAFMKNGKAKCNRCAFVVRVHGHGERCKVKLEADSNSEALFQVAWLGDVVHRRDVRVHLLLSGFEKRELGVHETQLVAGEAQAAFYQSYTGSKVDAPGTSVHSYATAFEASYYGVFRARYIRRFLTPLIRKDVPITLLPFLAGF